MDSNLVSWLFSIGGLGLGVLISYVVLKLKKNPNFYLWEAWATAAVQAAEQMIELETNEEKLEYASNRLSEFAKAYGYDLSPELVRTLIESAVHLLNKEK